MAAVKLSELSDAELALWDSALMFVVHSVARLDQSAVLEFTNENCWLIYITGASLHSYLAIEVAESEAAMSARFPDEDARFAALELDDDDDPVNVLGHVFSAMLLDGYLVIGEGKTAYGDRVPVFVGRAAQ